MKAFMIKKGTNALAVNFKKSNTAVLDDKVIKKDTIYYLEDIGVDPLGHQGAGPNNNSIGGMWAKQGYYGFKLPENSQGYTLLLVHGLDVIVK